jgi:outer membrane phospholipase A
MRTPVLSNLYVAYTQVSLWDISNPQEANIDTTFMPEAFFATRTPPFEARRLGASALGFQIGVQHESNGRSGEEWRTSTTFTRSRRCISGIRTSCTVSSRPRQGCFLGGRRTTPTSKSSWALWNCSGRFVSATPCTSRATGRIGENADKGSFQLDATYPLNRFRLDAYFQVQYFNGFAETLLGYREHHQEVRLGVGFVR